MRILVAEDERITRASLVRQLEKWGHEVTAAEDGELAWDAFQGGAFDIVLTDWEMPRDSGVELIERIRSRPDAGESYVYIIMLTGRSDKSDIVSGIEAGADDFVSKPFDREELRVRLLSGERIVRLERALSEQNEALRAASEKMRRDLDAAAGVQRALLPREPVENVRVRSGFVCVPTDELAGDALGLQLVDDRHLVSYIVDVTGHGVPAALLAVTVMHALSPAGEAASMLRKSADGATADLRPSGVVTHLNRRFCAGDNAGRFLTLILCSLDTHTGRLRFSRAGHPLPVIVRNGQIIDVDNSAGLPIGIVDDGDYEDVEVQLQPGDRVYIQSDGIFEQFNAERTEQFGDARIASLLAADASPESLLLTEMIDTLSVWAGSRSFDDDVSLLVFEWLGAP